MGRMLSFVGNPLSDRLLSVQEISGKAGSPQPHSPKADTSHESRSTCVAYRHSELFRLPSTTDHRVRSKQNKPRRKKGEKRGKGSSDIRYATCNGWLHCKLTCSKTADFWKQKSRFFNTLLEM